MQRLAQCQARSKCSLNIPSCHHDPTGKAMLVTGQKVVFSDCLPPSLCGILRGSGPIVAELRCWPISLRTAAQVRTKIPHLRMTQTHQLYMCECFPEFSVLLTPQASSCQSCCPGCLSAQVLKPRVSTQITSAGKRHLWTCW